jgi:hypothetical protein
MSDICERLRSEVVWEPEAGELMAQAADEIARLRLTDEERGAVEAAIAYMAPVGNYDSRVQDTLRGLLERLG